MGTFLNLDNDCICALATAWGPSAIAIIRLSGRGCGLKIRKLIRPCLDEHHFHTRFIRFATFVDLEEKPCDQIILIHFPGPRSFTGEDSVELQCHGAPVIIDAILDTLLSSGFRHARRGEFTRRAFLNGKIDLLQAESIQDLIHANNLHHARQHLGNLEGLFSQKIIDIKSRILSILGQIEATIDFPEDDIDPLSQDRLLKDLVQSSEMISTWLRENFNANQTRRTPHCVIHGQSNVGKSTLFNALLGKQRSIVSDLPGTTRDYIQETIIVHHFQMILTDTAGIRPTSGEIERMGMQKSLEILQEADLVLFVIDGVMGWTMNDTELFQQIEERNYLILVNKCDLVPEVLIHFPESAISDEKIMYISSLSAEDLERVKQNMMIRLNLGKESEGFISFNDRQRECLKSTLSCLITAEGMLIHHADLELVAIKVREGIEKLAEMMGENISESLLDHLFSKFCIGK
ncbi:MAG: tRNA uridine-5-carboxymethylaminomethyl(34) synthesis GTPase MnmE [Magnetococcales bacterium]|nr:tRNA uridine-5-carboxymethylaminomethyl(34) synthesis GTPase MnmE [Magnetococcales bacterium]